MSIFRWHAPKANEQGLPHGLNTDKLDSLRDLSDNGGYRIFVTMLQDIAEDMGLNLLHYKEPADFRYHQGYINALRDVQTLIPNLVQEHDRPEARPTRPVNGAPDKRSLYGTPYWDAIFGSNTDA